MGFGDYLKRGLLAVGTGGLSEVDRAAGSPVGGFLKSTYGTPDAVTVPVDPKDYSGVAYNPYASWLENSQAYRFDPTQTDQSRGLALQAAQGYQGVINGSAPSLAQQQLQQGQAAAAAQATQLAASARGGPGATLLAQQQAQRTGAGLALAGNAQAAQLRAQEVNAATAGLAQLGTSLYGADQNAQQMQQQNYQQFQQMQNQGRLALATGRQDVASQYATDKLNAQLGTVQANTAAQSAAAQRRAGLLTQVGQIIGKAGAGGAG